MAKKYKLTGCARFLIFLVIFAPLVYFGVSYFRGEDPIAPIKKVIPESWGKESSTSSSDVSEDAIIQGTIDAQKDRIKDLEKQVKRLEEIIEDRDKEIEQLRGGSLNRK